MENITNFFESNLYLLLLSVIILSGIFITKYTKEITVIKDVYKVLIASIFISIILYFIDDCTKECYNKYIFTYLFATSFYELLVKFIIDKVSKITSAKK